LEPKIVKEKLIPERYRNFSPERAARMLLHARRHILRNIHDQGRFAWDYEVIFDSIVTLEIALSKVRLGVDVIRA
jgi:hypothetical protein